MGGLRYVDWQQQTLPFAAAELGLTSHPAKVILILCTRSYMYSATFVALIFTYICFFNMQKERNLLPVLFITAGI